MDPSPSPATPFVISGPPGEVVRARTAVAQVLDTFRELCAHDDPFVLAGVAGAADRLLLEAARTALAARRALTAAVDAVAEANGG